MYLRTISTLQNLSFSCCCVAARQPRVSQKTSNVNDAELPHLEGTVTLDRHICHTSCGWLTMREPPILAPAVLSSLLLATCIQPEPIPSFSSPLWVACDRCKEGGFCWRRDGGCHTPSHVGLSHASAGGWIQP